MPNLGELASYLVGLITDAVGSSEMRLGPAPTVAILVVLLVLLFAGRAAGARWSGTGLGGLARVGRVMALAAESGADATISLGSAGIGRAASATERFQTLAALPLLGHVADAAARAGVPLRVTTNDPVAATVRPGQPWPARTSGRRPPSVHPTAAIEYVGEGRSAAAAFALATAQVPRRGHGRRWARRGCDARARWCAGGRGMEPRRDRERIAGRRARCWMAMGA